MWLLAEVFFAYQFILRVSPGVIMHDIMEKFNINATSFGVLASFYYLGYAGMQIPVGIALDKYGPKKIVSLCAFICVIGNLMFIYSNYWLVALCGRFLIGFGSVAGFLGATKAVSLWFKPQHFAFMMSITFTLGYLGAIVGAKPVALMVERFGPDNVLLIFSGVGLIIGLLILSLKNLKVPVTYNNSNILQQILAIIKNRNIILVCICGALQVGPLEAFADIWGINYFNVVFGINRPDAALLTSAIYGGLCIGGPALAIISEKYNIHYKLCALCGIIMSLTFVLLVSGINLQYYSLLALMFIIGVCSGYQILIFTITSKLAPIGFDGITTSLTNMIVMSAGSFFHYVIGKVMDIFWDGKMSGNIRIYDITSYNNSIYVLPITLIIGCLGFIYLQPKKLS
jgi:MFS family permease